MRDVKRRSPELAVQAADLELHLLAQLPVQRAQRLVHQEHCRLDDHRPRERDALLLATRQLIDAPAAVVVELHHRQRPSDSPLGLRSSDAANAQAVGDVVEHRHMREKRITLEDHADVTLARQERSHVGIADVQ